MINVLTSKRKVLVLGGTSYFGKHLIDLLIANGDDVSLVSRGNAQVPRHCSFIKFDRSSGQTFSQSKYWDVVYDQSCYSSLYLCGFEGLIKNCGKYILTSSQAVYQPGLSLKEADVSYEDMVGKVNQYGLEKLRSEAFISRLTSNSIFARFPVVVGVNDPRHRLQTIIKKVSSGTVDLPVGDPLLQLIDEYDAAKTLFDIAFLDFNGAINLASRDIISVENLCLAIARLKAVNVTINWLNDFQYSDFDLIKKESKTLCLEKQGHLQLNLKSVEKILENMCYSF